MKHRSLPRWILGALTVLPLTLAQQQECAVAEPAAIAPAVAESASTNALSTAATAAADSDAPVKPVTTEKPLPPNIRPSGPVAEVIKLANSGLAESVMLAYVTNSQHTFNLSAEDIIYLNDIGVPGAVVTAMIQQDQALKASLAAAAAGPPGAMPDSGPGPAPGNEPIPEEGTAPAPDGAPPYAVEAPLAPPDEPTVPMFYDSLAPYGNWVDVQGYGRCWQPTVAVVNSGWQPYFDCGHWIYSDCGWYWLSDYSWGWAPFHYGTWFRHARLGWCWVPGHVWGPSWVCWRYNNDSCGWAPLPPGAGFTAGIGLTFHGHGVWDRDDFGLRPSHYHFVAWNHFNDRHLRPHRLPAAEAGRAFATSTVATRIMGDGHTVINNGLPPSRVVAATHRPIHTVALRQMSNAAVGGGRAEHFEAGGQALAIYRPSPRPAERPTAQGTSVGSGSINRSAQPLDSNPTPWMPRSGNTRQSLTELRQDNPPAGSTAPLILRGQQPSALRETRPANSLVVIGRGNSAPAARPAAPWSPAPSAERATPASSVPVARSARPDAEEAARVPAGRNAVPNEPMPQRNWMGMVSSSPQPSWFNRSESSSPRVPQSGAVPRPETRSYQPAPRPSPAEVPRYAPAQSYTPQRPSAPSWSAPARSPSFEARPAPSAAPAPSAPAARSSPAPQSGSGRNGR